MRILIVGAGDIGFQLSKRLSQDGYDITMVEVDAKRIRRVSDQLDVMLVEGSGTSYRVLKQADVEHADVLAAMTTSDEVNILACRLAKKAGVAITMARVRNPEFTDPDFVLSPQEMGVDVVIHPEKETADAVVRLIRQSSANYAIEFEEGKVQIVGVRLDDHSPLLNIPLEEIGRRYQQPPIRIAAIKRKQQTIIPTGKDILIGGDQVFAVCEPAYTERFIELTGQKDIRIDRIMILGGGLIGQFIAAELDSDVRVKIIESSVEKSWAIADNLPNTLIIHGDGTDLDLLATEGILDMDAFVAVTGDDENNTTCWASSFCSCLCSPAAFVMSEIGLDMATSFGAVAATLSNIGPGLGAVGPTDNYAHLPLVGKWVLSALMLMGRLEIYTVIVLLSPATWRK